MSHKIRRYFESTDQLGWDPGLVAIKELLERLGNPQDQVPVVHIAGTNGKGSTLAFLSSILQESGLVVGRFNSPGILRQNEMITINGMEIDDVALEALLEEIEKASLEMMEDGFRHPTSFEVMTAAAFLYFASRAEIALIETGMGGRLDATNVVKRPELCLIALIGMDHQAFLGYSIDAIAREKAGIFRSGVPIVSAPQGDEAHAALQASAKALKTGIRWVDEDLIHIHSERKGLAFTYDGQAYQSKLRGRHQTINATLAIEGTRVLQEGGWVIDQMHIQAGIGKAQWPGRFEVLGEKPLLILDGAHNAQGMKALNEARKEAFDSPYLAVVGVLGEKEMGPGFLEILQDAHEVWTATPNSPRALSAGMLTERLKDLGIASRPMPNIEDLAELIQRREKPCLVFGSLYLIGTLRAKLMTQKG